MRRTGDVRPRRVGGDKRSKPSSCSCAVHPDFDPIENAFSKLKALPRKAAARAVDELWSVIGQSLDAFTAECANSSAAARCDAW